MQNLLKNPWISLGSTPDHKAVTPGLLFHPNHILCTENIPISNDWNGHSLFHLPDDIPVCFSGIILLSRSSMYSNSRHSTAFRNLCNFHCIDMFLVKPFSNLDSHRFFHCFYKFGQNLLHQFRILHQCRAFPVIYYLRHRTSHIKIQNFKRAFLNLCRHCSQNIRI